jgi:hypothetical protein
MTAQELIDSVLRLIGITASGETPTSDERNGALEAANGIIDSWNNEPNAITKTIKGSFSLTGTSTYTIGSGGSWNTTRPLLITGATATSNGVSQPVEIVDGKGWSQILERSITALFPKVLYCDYAYPTANAYVAPLSTGLIEVTMVQPMFTEFASLATTVTLPPAYRRLLRFALAVELAPEFGRPIDPSIVASAAEMKASIGGVNQAARGIVQPPAPAR